MNRLMLRTYPTLSVTRSMVHPFRMDLSSIMQKLLGHGRAILKYHFQSILIKQTILRKLDRIGFAGGGKTSTYVHQALPNTGPLEWISEGIQQQVRRIFRNGIRPMTNVLNSHASAHLKSASVIGSSYNGFIGRSWADGPITNQYETTCREIRESFERRRRQFIQNIASASPNYDRPDTMVPSVANLEFGSLIATGSSAAVYSAKWKYDDNDGNTTNRLGVKMMFNYWDSNSALIIRKMGKELVPALRISNLNEVSAITEMQSLSRCPPHENIVEISDVFADQMPLLSESLLNYPDALPQRLNDGGLGRNMTLFLVMKLYDCSLEKYLLNYPDLKLKSQLLILTQLLEGVTHLNTHRIAHRDLKSDNILLEFSPSSPEYPHVVITDFGCCLADKVHGLHLPFPTPEIDRGGNAALMAPEISGAIPGTWKTLSYEKSDVWSIGAIAYEIFGSKNPFVRENNRSTLDSRTFVEKDLPSISDVPPIINHLIKFLLKKNPADRLSAEMAATICQVYMWSPPRWLIGTGKNISDSEIMNWLLALTTKLLCQRPTDYMKLEFRVISTFLSRLRFSMVRQSVNWISEHMYSEV